MSSLGGNSVSVGEAAGFGVEPRDGNQGGTENRKACGRDFTVFH